jgi:hypothetical protein
MSDANYKKVGLDGPSIEQVVHPLAAAEFVGVGAGGGGGARNKRMVNSCSGNIVDAEVDLRVSGFSFLSEVLCLLILGRERGRGTLKSRSSDPRAQRRYGFPRSRRLGRLYRCLYPML